MVNTRSRRNLMTKVRVNDANLTKIDKIKDGVCNAFPALFFSQETRDRLSRACVLMC